MGLGKRKIEMKEIEDKSRKQVTFSKRRKGLFKKAAEFRDLTGTQVAILVISPAGRPYTFGDYQTLIDQGNYLPQCHDDLDAGQLVDVHQEPLESFNEYSMITEQEPLFLHGLADLHEYCTTHDEFLQQPDHHLQKLPASSSLDESIDIQYLQQDDDQLPLDHLLDPDDVFFSEDDLFGDLEEDKPLPPLLEYDQPETTGPVLLPPLLDPDHQDHSISMDDLFGTAGLEDDEHHSRPDHLLPDESIWNMQDDIVDIDWSLII